MRNIGRQYFSPLRAVQALDTPRFSDKWAPDKWAPGQMDPERMGPGQIDSGTNGPRTLFN